MGRAARTRSKGGATEQIGIAVPAFSSSNWDLFLDWESITSEIIQYIAAIISITVLMPAPVWSSWNDVWTDQYDANAIQIISITGKFVFVKPPYFYAGVFIVIAMLNLLFSHLATSPNSWTGATRDVPAVSFIVGAALVGWIVGINILWWWAHVGGLLAHVLGMVTFVCYREAADWWWNLILSCWYLYVLCWIVCKTLDFTPKYYNFIYAQLHGVG